MANYNLQVNLGSNFKPYTFQDLVAPLLLYKEDYQKMQDKLEKYSEKLGEIALPEDSAYSAQLQQYKSDLQSLVDSFYNQGLNYKTGAAANMMFRRAGTELTPIQKGIERYNAAVDKVTQLRMQDPTAFVTTDMSLDRFIGNAANPQIEAISGKQVAQDIALQTKAHLEQIEKEGKISNPKTGWAISMLKQNKISLEQLQQMANDPNSQLAGASEEIQGIIDSLKSVYDSTRKRYGYDNLSDSGKQNLNYYMSLGASTGMTIPEQKLGTDEPYYKDKELEMAQQRINLEKQRIYLESQRLSQRSSSGGGGGGNSVATGVLGVSLKDGRIETGNPYLLDVLLNAQNKFGTQDFLIKGYVEPHYDEQNNWIEGGMPATTENLDKLRRAMDYLNQRKIPVMYLGNPSKNAVMAPSIGISQGQQSNDSNSENPNYE